MINGVRAENDSTHAIIMLWGFVHKAFILIKVSQVRPSRNATSSYG